MEISDLQNAMKREYYERDKGRGIEKTVLWLVEEVGELAEAILRSEKLGIEEEIADIIAWAVSIANLFGIDVEKALVKKYFFLSDLSDRDSPSP